MLRQILLTASTLLVLSAGIAYGDNTEKFVKEARESGDFEIASSELAQQKSNSASVKEFAGMMIRDHQAAAQKLEQVSSKAGLPPEEAGVGQKAKHTEQLEKLQKAGSAEFDELYISIQRNAHKVAVKLFSDYSKNGDEASLKQFAADTLPTLQMHLEHAEKLKAQ